MIQIDMEMPEKCGLCPQFHAEHPMHCQGVKADCKKKIVAPYRDHRPDWCPLHEADSDTINRRQAIDALTRKMVSIPTAGEKDLMGDVNRIRAEDISAIRRLPSAQPFHNITMDDVLKYIDRMPEDVWQEFTACLECRGWELQRRTAKWCGSEFA